MERNESVRYFALLLLVALIGLNSAQSQLSATVTADHGEVTAGDTVNMVLTFDEPASCSSGIALQLTDATASMAVVLRGGLEAGKNVAQLLGTVQKDSQGTFKSSSFILYPCEGFSHPRTFTIAPLTLTVKGIRDPNTYPTKAVAVLSLTQKQFLSTKAAELADLTGQVDTRVEEDGRDSSELRAFLLKVVESAASALETTAHDYQMQQSKPNDQLPSFFEDFRRQYAHLHVELRSPIPGTRATSEQHMQVLYVQQQLNRRTPSQSPAKGRNISGTSPAIARAVKQTISDNASAYNIVNSTGRSRFSAQFSSQPKGATIFYRQAILPDFKAWPTPTDISLADFDLATTIFKFHKDECSDEPVRTIDPYDDTHPIISVEFKRCSKK